MNLTVFDEDNKIIHHSINSGINKVQLVKINNDRYNAIKPANSSYIKINKLLQSLSHLELRSIIIKLLKSFSCPELSDIFIGIVKNKIILHTQYFYR